MSGITQARPAYRTPWTHGAAAYHEADTFEALREGAKRKRKPFDVLMPVAVVGHMPCVVCGVPVGEPSEINGQPVKASSDRGRRPGGYTRYNPRTKVLVADHYECGWTALMTRIIDLGRAMQL